MTVSTPPLELETGIERVDAGMFKLNDSDTLDDLPTGIPLTAKALDAIVFHPWRDLVGYVVRGRVNLALPKCSYWGNSVLRLTANEGLQMRVTPKGVIGNPYPSGVVIVSTRIFNANGEAMVTTAFLWQMPSNTCAPTSESDSLKGVRSMACRCCHALLPSLFNHHDSASSDEVPMGSGRYACLDRDNYHAIRTSTYTVVRYECENEFGKEGFSGVCSTTPGYSIYVVAGALVGSEVPEPTTRSHETIKYAHWHATITLGMSKVQAKIGKKGCTDAINCSMLLLDALSFEGILGMISNAACEGALPDMMHSPGGIPLLIACAIRVAAYSEKYSDLSTGMEADRIAAKELCAHFEAGWEPIVGDKATNRAWAIDVVLREGLNDARAEAKKKKMGLVVFDNLVLVQRAAFRLISTTFGKTASVQLRSAFGSSSLVGNPISEARDRVIARRGLVDSNDVTKENYMRLCSRQDLKKTLVNLMNSVEEWIRTGMYCGTQINVSNSEQQKEENRELVRMNASSKEQRKADFKREFKKGGKKAMEKLAKEGKEKWKNVKNEVDELTETLAEAFVKDEDLKEVVNRELCVDALIHANSAVAALFCQGFSVHHQMDVDCFLVNKHATNSCADCNSEIHVVPTVMLNAKHGRCETCKRPRCFRCKEAAIVREVATKKRFLHCMRCGVFQKPPARK